VVLSEETVAIEFERRLRELATRAPRKTEAFLVQMNPRVSSQFTGNGARVLHLMEIETGKHFLFTGSEGLPIDHFEVVMEGGLDEIRDEAIPFRDGDEVLVTIVEPHMYEVDDAVAKIDGYIVSVAGGGAHVGEKRLVRIVEAGRTAASAVLVDNGASPKPAKAPAKPRATAAKSRATAAKRPAATRKPAASAASAEADEDAPAPRRASSRRKQAADPVEEAADTAAASDADGAATTPDAPASDEEPATPRRRTRRKPAPVDPEAEALEQQADEAADAVADGPPEDSGEGDAVESKPRRRGRRGGRRRSAAKAEATPAD
jgi:ribonuclease G